ncbi:MAG: DUF1574 domain-containing protein [Elusimicrobia bacterium]|nr:DUF1574 domain-containing protein [Candidatus Liberimonas magnetica]
MEGNLSIFSFNALKTIPKTLLFFIFLCVITELLLDRVLVRFITNPTTAKVQAKLNLVKKGKINNDVLVFGDSCAAAINAALLEKNTGLTAFNLSLPASATMAGEYFLLKESLRVNKSLKYIIMMNTYDMWYRDFNYVDVVYVLFTNFPLGAISTFFNPYFWNKAHINISNFKKVINHLLPSQRYKYEIRKLVAKIITERKGLGGLRTFYDNNQEELYAQLLRDKGSSIYDETDENLIKEDKEGHLQLMAGNNFSISGFNKFYLQLFFNDTAKNNIKVFICCPPLLRELYDRISANPYVVEYESFVKNLPKTNKNVFLLTSDFYLVPAGKLSKTVDHFNGETALVFTEYIAKGFWNTIKAAGNPSAKEENN